jgi:hypothetical protein
MLSNPVALIWTSGSGSKPVFLTSGVELPLPVAEPPNPPPAAIAPGPAGRTSFFLSPDFFAPPLVTGFEGRLASSSASKAAFSAFLRSASAAFSLALSALEPSLAPLDHSSASAASALADAADFFLFYSLMTGRGFWEIDQSLSS